ncbi:disease resistance protein RML1A-like [Eucalyptus grandis]|uniref:disease resistance protein RML1A-like n=1 Tax=Eucalyptus grandis TaxID=71139 RepID=UPI00192E89D5|nr:disease resistance protein RML1A-like [Eucalyptus grandis]
MASCGQSHRLAPLSINRCLLLALLLESELIDLAKVWHGIHGQDLRSKGKVTVPQGNQDGSGSYAKIVYIPILSRTYASSQWCLRELEWIVDNTSKSKGDKVILPIFYGVEPNDVKLRTPLYHDAILNLECEKKLSDKQENAWREALKVVGAIKGWEAKKFGYGELIKFVVEEVLEKLKTKDRLVTKYLVGIENRVVAVKELLDVNFDDVHLIQIHGMGVLVKRLLPRLSSTNSLLNLESIAVFLKMYEKNHQVLMA